MKENKIEQYYRKVYILCKDCHGTKVVNPSAVSGGDVRCFYCKDGYREKYIPIKEDIHVL